MQSERRIIVLKFGSSVWRSESDLPTAVHEIYHASAQEQECVA
jgi:hypothetical protein